MDTSAAREPWGEAMSAPNITGRFQMHLNRGKKHDTIRQVLIDGKPTQIYHTTTVRMRDKRCIARTLHCGDDVFDLESDLGDPQQWVLDHAEGTP